MNELQTFQNESFGQVRAIMRDGEPWFGAADVCRSLEIGNPSQALSRLDEDEKYTTLISNESAATGKSSLSFVNEPGLYTLVLGSRKPEAKAFKRWITHEVVPTIRKHGLYATDELIANPDIAIAAFTALKEEREKRQALETTIAVQSQQLAEAAPKVSYYDLILNCKDLISVSKIAKDYGMSAIKMNETLRDLGIQYRQGNVWLLYQKYAAQGYTSTKTHEYIGSDGANHAKTATYWTQKGRLFIYNKLKENGIVPMIERGDDNAAT